ncbi:MAG: sugar ABC transporter permease [Solirubrobacterales bacterium]|nr:sugar ABC transporter permease [Solirubrobacterales bacterium]
MATVAGAPTTAPAQTAPPGGRGLTGRAKAERKLGLMLSMPAVAVMVLVAGFPIIYAFWLSLHRADLRFPALDRWIGLDNYISVLGSNAWWTAVFNTVIITFFSVVLELVLGLLIAEAMYRALYARTWIRVAVLVPYGAVTVVSAFAWSLAFNPATGFATQWLGLSTPPLTTRAGSFVVIILADVWKTTPFISLLMLGALALVPEDLYKAAKVDGATAMQRFWRITLPLIKPALMVAVLFRVLDAFRIYDAVYIITNGANNTTSVSLLGYQVLINRLDLGLGSAIAVLIFFSVCLIAVFFFRFLGASPQRR